MKPVPFAYERPETLDAALQMLADDADAVVLAGGQTLIPLLSMRLARPSRVVDIGRIAALSGMSQDRDQLVIGAMTRQAAIERDQTMAERLPLLAAALPWIGHAATRARGTFGGSIANADPSAEIPLVLVTLGGAVNLASLSGQRTVSATDFFAGPMMTALESGECVLSASLPIWPHTHIGVGFCEVANRRGDFAIVAAAAQIAMDDAGCCIACAVGLGGLTDRPLRLDGLAEALVGSSLAGDAVCAAVEAAVSEVSPVSDPHATASYRMRAAKKLMTDAINTAQKGALTKSSGVPG